MKTIFFLSLHNVSRSLRSCSDDAEVLKKELATVQRLMDDLTTDKERELGDLQKKLDDLQADHEALKNQHNSSQRIEETRPSVGNQ